MNRPALGVHDRVWAKALVLRDGDNRRAIVAADLLAFPPGFREAVAAALAPEGWQADQFLLLPSHTHTSIDMTALNPKNTFQIPQLGLFHKELHDWTVARLAEAIRGAARHPIAVAVGSITRPLVGWNRNRRHAGAVDQEELVSSMRPRSGCCGCTNRSFQHSNWLSPEWSKI